MKRLVYILLVIVCASACSKEDRVRYKMSGVYDMVSIEATYYTDGEVDSVKTIEDNGQWALEDNGLNPHNRILYKHEKVNPRSIANICNGLGRSAEEGELDWYLDDGDTERFTIWGTDGYGDLNSMFTVTTFRKGKIVLQYVDADGANPRDVKYMEVITLKSTY